MESPLTVEELVQELDEPSLIGWKLFSQSPTLTVYRRANEVCFFSYMNKNTNISFSEIISL
jgi:hypothetical protein